MKQFKTLVALVLALALTLTLVGSAFAGSLTVKNSEDDVTYKFYKVFDLTGQDTSNPADGTYDAVTYTIDSDWAAFFASNGSGADYIVATNSGSLNPIKIDGVTKYINITESNRVAFTNDAMAYAIDNSLVADATADGDSTGDVTVDNLELGYYLMIPVDMTDEKANPLTTGSIASVTSTIPDGTIFVKATKPTVEKTDDTISADIGQTVNYTLTGKVPNTSGTASFIYKLSDTMSDGLTFNEDVEVTIGGTAIAAATVTTWITYANNGFVITIPVVDYQDDKGENIVLTYSAVVNENAVSQTEKNSAKVIYGRDPDHLEESTPVEEEVYSAKIVINKYTGGDDTNGTKLPNAVFALMKIDNGTAKYYKYTAASGNNPATVTWVEVANAPTSGTATVTDAMANALSTAGTAGTITTVTTDNNGAGSFDGIADGTYYVIEIAAPAGYNRLDTPQSVTVTGTDVDDATHLENKAYAGQTEFDTPVDGVANVNNQTGSVLPSTGGIGTTLFYIVGAVLVLGAAAVIIARRKAEQQ